LEPFFIKALIASVGVAIATSVVGVFVLWKKMAYFGDAISHSAIFGIGIAAVAAVATIYGIIFCAVIFCFLIFALEKQNLYSSDTIIGIASCVLLAAGIILIAIFPSNISLENYLFGDLIVLSSQDILTIYLIVFFTVLAISFWFKKLLLTAINKDLAVISGVNVKRLELKFLLLTALVVAGLVKIVGIFLITSMVIMPAAIARNFAKTPLAMLFISIASSLVMVIGGLFLALFFNIPTSPAIIAFAAVLLMLSVIFGKVKS
jgi:zinc transport system permease protein